MVSFESHSLFVNAWSCVINKLEKVKHHVGDDFDRLLSQGETVASKVLHNVWLLSNTGVLFNIS